MERINHLQPQIVGRIAPTSPLWGLVWGLIGGLTGTLVMDLTLMGILTALGSPALACFSIVGQTVARFFLIENAEITSTIPLGIATHYLVGPVIGAVYGLVVVRYKILRETGFKKSTLLGILYVEILSQPLLATTPILLKLTVSSILLWYGGSLGMHLIAGAVLGAVVSSGMRTVTIGNHRRNVGKVSKKSGQTCPDEL